MDNRRCKEIQFVYDTEVGNYLQHSRYDNAAFLGMRTVVRNVILEEKTSPLWAPNEEEVDLFNLIDEVGRRYDNLIHNSAVDKDEDENISILFHESLAKAQMILAGRSGIRYITMKNRSVNKS